MSTGNANIVLILAFTPFLIGFALFSNEVRAVTDSIDATVKIGLCGDGFIDTNEQCEPGPPEELGSAMCTSEGFDSGSLSCNIDCTFDTSECVIEEPPAPAPSGGGGGGGGGLLSSSQTLVRFSGRAYPGRSITLLKDAQAAATAVADANADFEMEVGDLAAGDYLFSLYSEDAWGRRSALLTFPIHVSSNQTTNIENIFVAPTINVDKSEVRKGDTLAIFGQSPPGSEVTIIINSEQQLSFVVKSDSSGVYLHTLDTSLLEMGEHLVKSRAVAGKEMSILSKVVSFVVGAQTVVAPATGTELKSDVNGDGRINLIDFSITAYWYKRSNPPARVDLNNDGKVDLVDFSIMAFNWTG